MLWDITVERPSRCTRAVFDKLHKCEETLSFQWKVKLCHCRSRESKRKMPGVVFCAPEGHERPTAHQRQRTLGSIGNQHITIDNGDKRTRAAKRVMSFGKVRCEHYMMACPDQRLRKPFEQR